jgi:hypothetical protein
VGATHGRLIEKAVGKILTAFLLFLDTVRMKHKMLDIGSWMGNFKHPESSI